MQLTVLDTVKEEIFIGNLFRSFRTLEKSTKIISTSNFVSRCWEAVGCVFLFELFSSFWEGKIKFHKKILGRKSTIGIFRLRKISSFTVEFYSSFLYQSISDDGFESNAERARVWHYRKNVAMESDVDNTTLK